MTTTSSASSARSATNQVVKRALIIVQGVVTLFVCLIAFPFGAILAITNGILAFGASGTNRRLLAGFAIMGVLICLVIWLFLTPASVSGDVGPVTNF